MPQLPTAKPNLQSRLPIRIAQGDPQTPVETHTESPAGGEAEAHNPGAIPPAPLVFMNSVLVALCLIAFALVARRRLATIPRGFQNFAEFLVEALDNFTLGIIGSHGRKYTPLVGTVFLYILSMNLIGLIPGFHSPTSNLTITLALGVVVFLYAQYEGIRQNGIVNYFKHFAGPMWQLSPLMFPIELISEYIKPFTLAIRLFGNIFGEDVILIVLAGLAGSMAGKYFGWVPVQFPIMLLATLTAFVQALVFTILTCIYISLMTHHEDHDGEGAHDDAHSHATGH